ncbi:putative pectinesterase inhibitor domain, Cell wall/vacuolar inhibitor of fructosidase [Rosa chinensis]|uniref:Putative pectinesterase inhibitor domain, Cell wall/vacuolar inhibitor of fructosidase n=1 Tax=Rosa chinensis TaxID=74649 RepID=A0A2P6R0Z6_ROSCH|nr:cell wall / vacuolar inhibitor of fructosidase 1-like [Rosa chinensis]PRQ40100.1 putative pectinesterase inhibitor domain, Cell wall/vacuolar inhibitor of fructosidase [Rosa chinensis]
MKSIISVAVLICLFEVSFLPLTQCRVYLPTDANLIGQTCLQTPKPDLCVSSLESVPESSDTDIKGLALIMSDKVLKGKAQDALKEINELIKQTPISSNKALLACADYYGTIIEFHIEKQAHDGITGNQPRKAAQQAMDDTVYLVNECNNGLGSSPSSPLTVMGASVADIATITKAIVQILS